MKILLIDTCGETGSVALAETSPNPAMIGAATLPGRTASERLVSSIRDLATTSGVPLQSLEAVVVVHGPGSFTGVRVGLSAAKGLCEALHLPLIAISRLAVLAHLADQPSASRVHAVLDAGRGEFYVGVYLDGVCLREALLTRDELHAAFLESDEPRTIVVCEPAVATLGIPAISIPPPTAESALPLALRRIDDQAFDDVATLDANYLRRTDAEIFAKPRAAKDLHPSVTSVP